MQKKMITGIIAILVVVTAVLVFVNRKGDKNVSGLVLAGGGKEVTIAWEDVGGQGSNASRIHGLRASDSPCGKRHRSHREFRNHRRIGGQLFS